MELTVMDNSKHHEYMRMAIALSEQNVARGLGGPFGAVIVKNNEVIAASANTVVPSNDPTAHAEVATIRLACQKLNTYNLEGCVIYTSCEPCPMCLGAIYWARLDKIFYANTKSDAAAIGFDDQFIYEELNRSKEQRKVPMVALLRDEAQGAFKAWEITVDKDHY